MPHRPVKGHPRGPFLNGTPENVSCVCYIDSLRTYFANQLRLCGTVHLHGAQPLSFIVSVNLYLYVANECICVHLLNYRNTELSAVEIPLFI
jgi:hypothetical protein